MGMSREQTQRVADGALIDTGSNVLSLVGIQLLTAAKEANMRNTKPLTGENEKRLEGFESSIVPIGTFKFHF